jgi:hypothetical protein
MNDVGLKWVFDEIVARLLGIWLCWVCCQELRIGLAERKIRLHARWIASWVVHRDEAPMMYWFGMISNVFGVVCSLVLTIFGWRLQG